MFAVNAVPSLPQINSGGVVNNASYNLGASGSSGAAPGEIAAVFGTALTDGASCLPPACNPAFGSGGKLNTTMAGAQASVNGTLVPIFYAAPTQLGIQIPFEVTGTSATVSVSVAGLAGAPATVTLAPVAPGVFLDRSRQRLRPGHCQRTRPARLRALLSPSVESPPSPPSPAWRAAAWDSTRSMYRYRWESVQETPCRWC